LGLIDKSWKLSKRDPKIEAWSSMTEQEQKFMETMMEVYAAMVDLMPTFVELSGARYPTDFAGQKILPMEGIALTPVFKGKQTRDDHPIFWKFSGNHAIRDGRWKLVAERSKDRELYDLDTDRCENVNLISKDPTVADAWGKPMTLGPNAPAENHIEHHRNPSPRPNHNCSTLKQCWVPPLATRLQSDPRPNSGLTPKMMRWNPCGAPDRNIRQTLEYDQMHQCRKPASMGPKYDQWPRCHNLTVSLD
jgi:hypothetical protein